MPSPATSVKGSKENIRAHLFILGKVQGVYFRHNTRIIANRFGVKGWVRNLEDGQVEAVLEGDEINVNAVLEWCHRGPLRKLLKNKKKKNKSSCDEFRDFSIS